MVALAEGWPRDIDWECMIERVFAIRPELQRLVDDVDEEWQPAYDENAEAVVHKLQCLQEDPEALAARPRKENILWKSVTNDIIRYGSLYMSGLTGQFRALEKKLPG